jgi:hypothetical protein
MKTDAIAAMNKKIYTPDIIVAPAPPITVTLLVFFYSSHLSKYLCRLSKTIPTHPETIRMSIARSCYYNGRRSNLSSPYGHVLTVLLRNTAADK